MDIEQARAALLASVSAAESVPQLEEVRVAALGKKGQITALMSGLGQAPPDQRKALGAAFNQLKQEVSAALDARRVVLEAAALALRLASERIDLSLSARPQPEGSVHPISQTIEEMITIFGDMGFVLAEGPDIESDDYNFDRLNIPADHAARQDHDTFYMAGEGLLKRVLRTHTSPVQVRTMLQQKPPIRIIAPGRTYRCDYDATHSPMFHQIEGLVITEAGDGGAHMGHLKGCLIAFCQAFFGVERLPVRFRASYFPFTEPSAEMDIGCERRDGKLLIGEGHDWLEILGCGMVHPNVLQRCGLDPSAYQGFAFGLGIERAAMLKHGVADLRTFYEADMRWSRHHGFDPLATPTPAGGL
jgi:phenylalanyl-tRNA synthetase alpha chain